VIFNIIAMGFMIRPSTIISTVGEVMTPALLVLLLVVGITVFVSPLSDIVAPIAGVCREFSINYRIN
jgi:branched-chain amino acid:cation transporter, LIVCS family